MSLAISLMAASAGAESKKPGANTPTPEITAKADKEAVNIGSNIKLRVSTEEHRGLEFQFPETPENLGEFSLVDSKPIKHKKEIGREYIVSIYTTGTHVIPPVRVLYKGSGAADWLSADSPQIPIEVKSLLTGDYTDIRELKGIILPKFSMRRFVAFVLVLLAGAAWGWVIWAKKKKEALEKAARRKSAHEIAYDELARLKLLDLPQKGLIKEYYTGLSDIVRHYLEMRFALRAPEMTTEEFLSVLRDSPELKSEHKTLLRNFLGHCDMVKFAKYGPTQLEMLDSFRSAENLVDQTKLIEEKPEEEK